MWLLICCAGLPRAAAQEVTLDEIRARLLEWEQSFSQFWIVWETEWDPNSNLARQHDALGVESIGRNEWARSARGEEYWLSAVTNDGRLYSRDVRTRDHNGIAYSAMYGRGGRDPAVPMQLSIAPDPDPGDEVIRGPFLGYWDNRAGVWMGSALLKYPARVDGTRAWEGRELPFLIVETGRETELRLQLDPDVNYLPRTARIVHVGADETRLGHLYEVLEFREVQPGLFFPWRGRVHNSDNASTWRMLEVKLNEPLDHLNFTIEPADGTFVENLVTGRHGYHGTPPPSALTPTPDSPPAAADSSFAIAAVGRFPWTILLAVAGVGLLAGAWFLQRRGRSA